MDNQTVNRTRTQLLQIYSRTLQAVQGRRCVQRCLHDLTLPTADVKVVALGKAAASMMQGALDELGVRVRAGLVITKYQHAMPFPPGIRVIEAAHPVVDENSLLAGQALVEFVEACDESTTLLFLLSGGASALAEVLPDSVTLAQFKKINSWVLAEPFTIQEINSIRKRVSLIKGGKLAQHLRTPHCWQLTLSDVPGNDLSVIGSGLLVCNPSIEIAEIVLPPWVSAIIPKQHVLRAEPEETCRRVHHIILADNDTACRCVEKFATELQIIVHRQGSMHGDAEAFGRQVVQAVRGGEKGLYLWGGETVVSLPAKPGVGGRCQHLALSAAIELAGFENVVILAAGTDGTDGPGEIAGAMVDGLSIARGLDAGLDPRSCLRHADAGRFLDASGDLIDTGPTGTNVNDLVLALKW